jgi:hypothetical protein
VTFASGAPRPSNAGRKKGSRNKRTLAAAPKVYPDALEHLVAVMANDDGTITPDLKLRAAIGLAAYQNAKPAPFRTETFIGPIDYTAPKTPEEARQPFSILASAWPDGKYRSRRMMRWSTASERASTTRRPSRRKG